MAHLVPSISFLKSLKGNIEQGLSVHSALERAIQQEQTPFSTQILIWHRQMQSSSHSKAVEFETHYQKALIEIVRSGLEGAPVHEHLGRLEDEMLSEFERQWKAYLESLPFRLSIPLLLFFFPAYVVLLFGPLITQFLGEVQ